MTALIDKIDPNAHPRLWWGVLILQKIAIPITLTVCYAVVIILGGTTLIDGLESLDVDSMTPTERGLFDMFAGGFLMFGVLFFMRLRK